MSYNALNAVKEEYIVSLVLGKSIGAKQNLNYHVIANMMKIKAITSENKQVLPQDALEGNMVIMIKMMCDYIYEK